MDEPKTPEYSTIIETPRPAEHPLAVPSTTAAEPVRGLRLCEYCHSPISIIRRGRYCSTDCGHKDYREKHPKHPKQKRRNPEQRPRRPRAETVRATATETVTGGGDRDVRAAAAQRAVNSPEHEAKPSPVVNLQTPESEYLTVIELAARLKIHGNTVYSWIDSGRLGRRQGLRRIGRMLRVDWAIFKAEAIESGRF